VKFLYIILIAAVVIALRIWVFRKRRSRRAAQDLAGGSAGAIGSVSTPGPDLPHTGGRVRSWPALEGSFGDVGLIAKREITERVRGRILRVGTLIILIAVGAAIVIPTLHSGGGPTPQTVGVVGALSPETEQFLHAAGSRDQDSVKLVPVPSVAAAKADLRSGKVDFVIDDEDRILIQHPASSSQSPVDPTLVQDLAEYLGVLKAYEAAGLTAAQAALVDQAKPVPVQALQPSSGATTKATSVIGLVLLFLMLTQYNTWILIGVMQEKSSRVVEVLLAAVRPIQLLGGKVLGIGLVALGQATLIVGFALIVGAAVGSDLLRGTAPLVLACELLWLVLGYAFYCWVYAAAGSTAERQDQVQTLALPLSIPILLGYIFSITVASTGNPDVLFKILAYFPPTAPFCMSVLVGLGLVTWWEFVVSVLITIAGTVGVAIFAARIYRRAVLRTGGRVRVRELFARGVS
jgi:ABC-2 type transport system permease protein